uniref:Uncharacterized protein n=1 Tax=Arundo donax TaxID=35708 RepID=A0A0A8ZG79_ARUDO
MKVMVKHVSWKPCRCPKRRVKRNDVVMVSGYNVDIMVRTWIM